MAKTYVEKTLETLVEFADIHRQSMSRTENNINALTAQIGVLSESITRLEIQVDRIATVTERQAESIAQLIALAQQQQATVNQLLNRN